MVASLVSTEVYFHMEQGMRWSSVSQMYNSWVPTVIFAYKAGEGKCRSRGAPTVSMAAASSVAELPAFLLQLLEPVVHQLSARGLKKSAPKNNLRSFTYRQNVTFSEFQFNCFFSPLNFYGGESQQ